MFFRVHPESIHGQRSENLNCKWVDSKQPGFEGLKASVANVQLCSCTQREKQTGATEKILLATPGYGPDAADPRIRWLPRLHVVPISTKGAKKTRHPARNPGKSSEIGF